jgi:hypothetical protein
MPDRGAGAELGGRPQPPGLRKKSRSAPAVLARAANPPPESAPGVPKPRTAAAPRTAEGGTTTGTEHRDRAAARPQRRRGPRRHPMPKAAARGKISDRGRTVPVAPAEAAYGFEPVPRPTQPSPKKTHRRRQQLDWGRRLPPTLALQALGRRRRDRRRRRGRQDHDRPHHDARRHLAGTDHRPSRDGARAEPVGAATGAPGALLLRSCVHCSRRQSGA